MTGRIVAIEGLDRVYVINVKAFEDRRKHVTAELDRFHIRPEFIHDWDIPDLNDESERWFAPGATLTAAQKSCCMKHIEALRRIVARKQSGALVLEDDVVLAPEFADAIRRALAERSRFRPLHVVFMGSGGNFFTPHSLRTPDHHLYLGPKGRFADSYLINAETAGARLDWIKRHPITRPIDNEFDAVDRKLGIQLLWYEDPVVEQGSKNGKFRSQIERDPPPWLKGILFRWEKIRRKYLYRALR
jgi:glycosyl transferase, family 25